MSSWKKYGGTNNLEKISDIRVNSLVTDYFTILKKITNDIDISGNITVSNRLNVYGDVSFNQNLTVKGNVNIEKDLDVSGNSHIHQNQYIDGNLTVLNHLYFQDYPTDVYMYGNSIGIAVNKEVPEADMDIVGNNPCILNVKSTLDETHNILCRNVDDRGIMLNTEGDFTSMSFFYDTPMNINDLHIQPDAIIQYEAGGVLHIDASSHVQIVSNLIVTDNSANIVNDAVVTVYNDLENNTFLYDIYDVSSAYTGSAVCGVAKDISSNICINLITKHSEIGGGIYGGAYPKDITRGMLSLGIAEFNNGIYVPAQTIVEGTSNVKYKNTTGINKPVPILDRYAVDVNGPMRLEDVDITTAANIPFEINTMTFSRQYSNTGVVAGGVYKYNGITNYYSQEAYITKDGGSSWYPSSFLTDVSGESFSMRAGWVYDNNCIIVYGNTGRGYFLDISNNAWYNKNMLTIFGDPNLSNVIDIFACDFSGNKANNTALAKVFFIVFKPNSGGGDVELRYFNAAFGDNADAYAADQYYVKYKNNNLPIPDGTPQTYYRYYDIYGEGISGTCLDGAGYFSGIDCSSGYIYIAGASNIRKYLFSGISDLSEVVDCSHNVNGGYNAISVVDMSNVIAVGNGFISHTVDGGLTWIDISRNTLNLTIQNTVLRSVWAYDVSNAIAVGDNGKMVYTTNGYTWKNAPKQLFDLSGTGFPLIDASLNDVFIFNKNDFIVSDSISRYKMDIDASNIGYGKVIYSHVPELLNSENNSVLDLCGNMTIAGNIILDIPSGTISSTGNNMFIASTTPNIYVGDKTAQNIYLGNSDPNSTVYFTSKVNFGTNLRLDGGFAVTNGNIDITANGYLVSHGLDVSYGKIDVVNINGGNALSRIYNGHDVSYALHVTGYRPAARIDASLSVNQLYVDSSSILLGPMTSTYKSSNATYTTDPAIYVTGYSKFGPNTAIDGSNGVIIISNGIDAVSNPPNNLYGGLYLSSGTGAFIDGNVYISRNVRISGTSNNPFVVETGTATFNAMHIGTTLDVSGAIATSSNLYVGGTSSFRNDIDISGNVDISGNLDVSGNINTNSNLYVKGTSSFRSKIDVSGNVDVSGNIDVCGNIYAYDINCHLLSQSSDYRIKTNVIPLHDTSFNVDRIFPKYYYNTMAASEQFGFIAHELQEEYPFLVSGVKDGPKMQSVNYTGLIGLLVKEIQDLKERVSFLENGLV